MPKTAIEAPAATNLPIVGETARFPVGRIFCVGRNYADHAREMGADPSREPPFFFMKQSSAVVTDDADLVYPPRTQALHHEIELVVAIGIPGTSIAVANALDHVFGYAVGLDLTRRDLQDAAKEQRRPWDVSKSFDGAAPIGAVRRSTQPPSTNARIRLEVDGMIRQSGIIGQMIWSVPEIIAELSTYQELVAGDVIFTGTPAGVAAIEAGQQHGRLDRYVGRFAGDRANKALTPSTLLA